MSASRTNGNVFEETTFRGDISINGETAPISFRVSAGSDCRLHIEADNVDGSTYFLAVRNQGKPGASQEEFTLAGTSADGKSISSEHVFVRKLGHNDDQRWIDLRARACKITLPLETCVGKPVLRLWLRSFSSFRNPVIETNLGRLSVWGSTSEVGASNLLMRSRISRRSPVIALGSPPNSTAGAI
jgi:hypothetical protein